MSRLVLPLFLVGFALLASLPLSFTFLPGGASTLESILAPPAQPDFELRADPTNATLGLNDAANITIYVNSIDGFNSPVQLSLTQPINSDIGPSCPALDQSKTVTPNPSASWSFICKSGDNQVVYTLYIRAKATTTPLIHTVSVTLSFKASSPQQQYSFPLNYSIIGGIGVLLIALIFLKTSKKGHQPKLQLNYMDLTDGTATWKRIIQ